MQLHESDSGKSVMNRQIGILMLALFTFVSRAQTGYLSASTTVNTAIPDANPVGLTSTINVSGMYSGITSLTLTLDITGGFNGDLYAYLLSPDNTMVVLLNRVGMESSNPFGYSDAGFNITLQAAGYNIHDYQNYGPSYSGGQLIGSWMPDMRTIDPQSDPSAFDAAPTGNNFTSYYGSDPNGVWTLFVSDLSGENQSTLASWGLTIVTVPEPRTWTLLGGGLSALLWLKRNRWK
jgi:subtilisin-like proprotein convertase family protein